MSDKLKNTYAFIDSQNLNLNIRTQGWLLDFARFRVYLKEKYSVEKAFLFLGFIEENKKLNSLIIPNKFKFSALLKWQIFRPYLRFMNDLQKKLEYKKKRPRKDETL